MNVLVDLILSCDFHTLQNVDLMVDHFFQRLHLLVQILVDNSLQN